MLNNIMAGYITANITLIVIILFLVVFKTATMIMEFFLFKILKYQAEIPSTCLLKIMPRPGCEPGTFRSSV